MKTLPCKWKQWHGPNRTRHRISGPKTTATIKDKSKTKHSSYICVLPVQSAGMSIFLNAVSITSVPLHTAITHTECTHLASKCNTAKKKKGEYVTPDHATQMRPHVQGAFYRYSSPKARHTHPSSHFLHSTSITTLVTEVASRGNSRFREKWTSVFRTP